MKPVWIAFVCGFFLGGMAGFPLLFCLISVSHQVVARFAVVRRERLAALLLETEVDGKLSNEGESQPKCPRLTAAWTAERKGLIMKIAGGVLLVFLLLIPAFAWADSAGYGYSIDDSYAATILGTPQNLRPDTRGEVPVKTMVLETDQKKPEIFFYDRGLRYTVAFQNRKAPLVFLIAGTGGSSKSARIGALMANLYHAGFHVIALPSPTFPNFIIDASTTHVPGNLSDDANDLYRVMEQIWDQSKGRIEVSDFLLAGYSLGGTEAAFVAKLDDQYKVFDFRRVLMLNPAVNYTTPCRGSSGCWTASLEAQGR